VWRITLPIASQRHSSRRGSVLKARRASSVRA